MLLIKICFLFLALSVFHPLMSQSPLPSIVIIGGGPTGLAAAIEAKAAGANVTIVEKREQYLREQYIFLMEPALNLLDKWEVVIPELLVDYDDGEKVGAMKIKHLEIALDRRVSELEIAKIIGEFQELKDGKVIISQQNGQIAIPYDLLIGADGTHSAVRDYLQISSTYYGNAEGSITLIPLRQENESMEFIEPFRCGSLFLTKIVIPPYILISAQGMELSKEIVLSAAIKCGWLEEAKLISSNEVNYCGNIKISVQQSDTFVNIEKSVIILGDAAASASFLQGLGANCALETAMIAGHFFKTKQRETDWLTLNHAMQRATDSLIQESLFLFE